MIQTKISTKKGYVKTGGWRGYSQPIFAVAGANDTGSWEDSPCPSDTREREIKGFTNLLKKDNILYKIVWCESSNVFCQHCYVVVSEQDHPAAYKIATEYKENTRLFYPCEILNQPAQKDAIKQ